MQAPRREPDREPERIETYQPRVEPVERRPIDRDVDRYPDREGYYATMGSYGGRDLVHWGPVWAGVIGAFATMIFLGVLGLAVGLAAFEPGTPSEQVGTASSIWGAITLALSFFLGGWLAGRTASYHTTMSGILHGTMVWALGLTVVLLITGLGLGTLMGAAASMFQGANPNSLGTQVQPGQVAEVTQSGAIWTFVGLLVAWILAVVGSITGARNAARQDVGAA